MGKMCDLCGAVARMYCESDQASLCWDCDGKVHGANFLVAKHTRSLLCTACQSPTPWKASGLRLAPTFSVCDSCVALKNAGTNRILSENLGDEETSGNNYGDDRLREHDGDDAESYDDDDEEEEDEDEDEDEIDADDDEEAENQVVPWSAAALQPPMVSSSSSASSEGEALPRGNGGDLVTKRMRANSDLLCSDDEIGCFSGPESNYSRPSKRPSRYEIASKSTAAINSYIRLNGARKFNGGDTSSSSS